MGWHRNHAISHSPNQHFFEDTFVSHPGGPNEQFGTHEKLSWGVQGNLNWMPGYRGQGSGSRFSKQFSSDTAGYSQSRFELNVRKNACNKIIFPIFAFLFIAAGL